MRVAGVDAYGQVLNVYTGHRRVDGDEPAQPWAVYLAGTDATFASQSSRASAHYGIGATGEIHQYVSELDGSYSDANYASNNSTISIEHANSGSNPWTVHEKAIESGAHLVAALCLYYGLGRPEWCKNVFPHRYWSATACPGELAGSQRDHYMQRAQAWYDAMKSGKAPAPSTAKPATAKPAAKRAPRAKA